MRRQLRHARPWRTTAVGLSFVLLSLGCDRAPDVPNGRELRLDAPPQSASESRDQPKAENALPADKSDPQGRPYADRGGREGVAKHAAAGLGAVAQLSDDEKGNARSLSELDYQNEQSLKQRANEAAGYFGVHSLEAGATSKVTGEPALDLLERNLALYRGGKDLAGNRDSIAPRAPRAAGPAGRKQKRGDTTRGETEEGRPRAPARDPSPGRRFARERKSLEHLTFQPASGYWDNTYVPGDPVLRWLESRLRRRDPAALEAFAKRPLVLDDASQQGHQPFDAPTAAALSVFAHADRPGLDSEGRMLVQVGLRGAERHSRMRPAMNVGIVLDLRGAVAVETGAAIRALLEAFLEAKSPGDAFAVTVAGVAGEPSLAPDGFRHGPIQVLVRELFDGRGEPTGMQPLGLVEAVRRAAAATQRTDDPTAPLGSSVVLLVTAQPLGALADPLAALAHESAVGGVPVSAVAVGTAVPQQELERIILAGQGNRRVFAAPADAKRVVAAELSSQSRVIARAVRLRIRLAPGVRLVEVVGSQRLDTAGAGRIRQAERAIDRRLSRNLGIEADRGQDEEGIQIVIPTFYSGDSHAVLLDVVAGGPGPIADATVRYKDLVYLRNGVARANLTLGRETKPAGPLERNVVKNYLAQRLAETLKEAGRTLLAGDGPGATARVLAFRDLLSSLAQERTGLHNDGDLVADVTMLDEYLSLLEAGAVGRADTRDYVADSLQLSGWFKTVPRRR